MNHYFQPQTPGKRFLAGFLDLVFVLILSIFAYIPAVHITNAAGWAEAYQELYRYGITSGLYKPNDAGGFDTVNEYANMPKALYDFYVDHPDDDGNPFRGYSPILVKGLDDKNYTSENWLRVKNEQVAAISAINSAATIETVGEAKSAGIEAILAIEEITAVEHLVIDRGDAENELDAAKEAAINTINGLVDGHDFNSADDFYDVILKRGSANTLFNFPLFESGEYEPYAVPQLSGKTNQVETFLTAEMEKAYDAFNEYPAVNQLLFENIRYQAITIASAYLVSAFILIVLLPLILKDKVTLGKLVTKTIVLNRFGFKITSGRAFARNLALFLLSFVFFFLPFHLVSFFFCMFSKKRESLFDMIAFTLVADKKDTIVFKNVEEETAHRKKLAQSLLTIEKRKAENRQLEIDEKREKFIETS